MSEGTLNTRWRSAFMIKSGSEKEYGSMIRTALFIAMTMKSNN